MRQTRRMLEGKMLYTDKLPIYVARSEEGFYFEQHTHDFVEIIYVEEGTGFHYIEDELVRVKRGDVFYLPVGTSHIFRPSGQPPAPKLVIYNCDVDANYLKQLQTVHGFSVPSASDEGASKAWFAFEDRAEEIGGLFRSMYQEYHARLPGCRTALTAWVMLLHVKLFDRKPGSVPSSESAGSQMQTAISWLDQHCTESGLSLEQAAEAAGVSPRHFRRLFKQATGRTFLEYVQHMRISHGCMLLETTGRSVADIAELAGYKDLKSFNRVFKQLAGCTPSAYRRARR
ncbi:helix-turn-helix domain-containing protein [Paenibacillus sacheonensis]|uniref:Helix-turn-helix domain-containing protein n=1 Tax=Paenibacillus sacheonensis TaxID=742054 RepID=A0A7X4YL01_9BACL|nr:AraC-like DNA-binding protein [Paenibacillus sacheonensis]NBC68248.1 helix-turn-helix domain-containing protein [Paenibacillus sacheonensis]